METNQNCLYTRKKMCLSVCILEKRYIYTSKYNMCVY